MAKKRNQHNRDREHLSDNHDKWKINPLNNKQAEYMDAIDTHQLVISCGYPGTAKTLIAIYKAFEYLDDRGSSINKIIVCRNICDNEGSKTIGMLPGTLEEKIDPLMSAIYDNMKCFMTDGRIKYIKSKGSKIIEFVPYEYIRGRSFEDSFIIVEEAQNFLSDQMYSILTRIGERSKMVVNGDYKTQRDLSSRYGESGLKEALIKTKQLNSVKMVLFDKPEYIERSPIVKDIIMAYYGDTYYDI